MRKLLKLSFFLFICSILLPFIGCSKTQKITIGFYEIPEEFTINIKAEISKINQDVNFINISEADNNFNKLIKKTEILVSYNNKNIQDLKENSAVLSKNIIQMYPNSIKTSELYTNRERKMTVLPVLLDNFEFGVLKITQTRYGAKLPETIYEIDDFCNQIKPEFSLPIIISGADDINVNSFFSLLVQSYGGLEGYLNVADQLSKTTDFSQIYDYKISGEAPDYVTVRTVLNDILYWQQKSYINPKWMINTQKNTDKFIENGISAISLMNMSEQRNKSKPNANYYKPETFPLQTAKTPVSIQPAIVAISLKKSSQTKAIFEQLSSISVQEQLSNQTKLAPAILQGEAYDSLSSTARYNAASYSSGPVPDLGTLSLSSKDLQHQLAEAIRNFCSEEK